MYLRPALFILFALSGFSGLIYESIWSHYLKLILGHAAYAQTLVLAIFMGGMTLGAWFASQKSKTWQFPLLVYAIIEGVIGLCGLIFHGLFLHITDLLHQTLIPTLGYPLLITTCKWGIAASLIMPQSILLGATFPAMSAGIIRRYPDTTGATLAMLYFTNSLGAALGVLASGFVFIPQMGLPATIQLAGVLNLLLAAVVWLLVKILIKKPAQAVATATDPPPTPYVRLLLAASLLTGAASFFYEIAWIRLLSLVLSSTTQAFELMLSAFITGLAFGGLWIRRRIDSLVHPLRYAGHVQILMGIFALTTLPLYNNTFDLMAWMLASLGKTDGGYTLFNLGSHAIALGIMLPATFMAGMTLPLFTYALIKRGHGEVSIGQIYAANTIGAILGVTLATHLVMPLAGSKGLIGLGAAIDIGLGAILLRHIVSHLPRWESPLSIGAGAVVLLVILFGVHLNPLKMASGVYRYGHSSLPEDTEVLYHKEGKTATVDLMRDRFGGLSIGTNGKPEASIYPPDAPYTSSDDVTMVLAAALPLAFHPQAQTVANIGMGSGITAHALLGTQKLKRVDTIEIEAAVVEAAKGFGTYVTRAYSDPRSHIHIDDAKTFFSSRQTQYDIIISEPSDPWVSGVAGLFSTEFYTHINRYLQPDGIFVQWLELYESNMDLIASVFKALAPNFTNYVVFNTNDTNILIIATNNRPLTQPDPWIFEQPGLSQDLTRTNLKTLQDLTVRRLGDKAFLQPLFETYFSPSNSDYAPYLSYHAPKSRFLGEDAGILSWLHLAPIPVLEMLGNYEISEHTTLDPNFTRTQTEHIARKLQSIVLSRTSSDVSLIPEPIRHAAYLLSHELETSSPNEQNVRESAFILAKHTASFLPARELDPMWKKIKTQSATLSPTAQNWLNLHHAIARRDGDSMIQHTVSILNTHTPAQLSQPQLEYLIAAGLAGAQITGGQQRALQFWSQFGMLGTYFQTDPELYVQLLLAQLDK